MDASPTGSFIEQAEQLIALARKKQTRIVTVESCTAGALSTLLSEIPEAGDVLEGGFVSYSKSFKALVLGVSAESLEVKSAVDAGVAVAMARGALKQVLDAHVAVAITGVCGPKEDEDGNPVGLAYIAAADRQGGEVHEELRIGEKSQGHLRGTMMSSAIRLLTAYLMDHAEDEGKLARVTAAGE